MLRPRRAVIAITFGMVLASVLTSVPASGNTWMQNGYAWQPPFYNAGTKSNISHSSPVRDIHTAQAYTSPVTVQDPLPGGGTAPITLYAASVIKVGGSQSQSAPGGTATLSYSTTTHNFASCWHLRPSNAAIGIDPTMLLTCKLEVPKVLGRSAEYPNLPPAVSAALQSFDVKAAKVAPASSYKGADFYRATLTDGQECVITAARDVAAANCVNASLFAEDGISASAVLNGTITLEIRVFSPDDADAGRLSAFSNVGADVYAR